MILNSARSGDAFIAKADSSGNYLWVKQLSGAVSSGITVDGLGNVYTTGSFVGTVDFDPGAGIANLTSKGLDDLFISKLDSNGNYLWAKQIGEADTYERSNGIAVDATGNIYTMGYSSATIEFNSSFGLTDPGFISKLDSNGNTLWSKQVGYRGFIRDGSEAASDSFDNIAIDSKGNLYAASYFSGTVDFDPGPGVANLTAQFRTACLIKWDSNGNYLWAKQFNSDITGVSLDGMDNVYTTGRFSGTVDFDPGSGTVDLTSTGYDLFISKLDSDGKYLWAKQLSGNGYVRAQGISVDRTGNVYTTGYFNGTADFDPGVNQALLTSSFSRYSSIFISKLDSSGNYLWARQINADNTSSIKDISIDGLGNVYTTGRFEMTVDFDPGVGVVNLIGASSFISKLNSTGDYVSAQKLSSGRQFVGNIFGDAVGNVYTTGNFFGTVDFDPGLGQVNLVSSDGDAFISKSDSQGKHLWTKQFGRTSGGTTVNLITVDQLGNIYAKGTFSGNVDFDPGAGIALLSSSYYDTSFISKLDVNGNYLWARSLGTGNIRDTTKGIAVDSLGNVYDTGTFSRTADLDPGDGTAFFSTVASISFVRKLDKNGNYLWAKPFISTTDTEIPYDRDPDNAEVFNINNIAVDSAGNVYTVGRFVSTVDFDPGSNQTLLTSTGESDVFVSKLDSNGNYIWAKQLGSSGNDVVNGIRLDDSGNIYTTGSFEGSGDFDPGTNIATLTSAGKKDIFISKLDNNGSYLWAKQIAGTDTNIAESIVLDRMNNIYLKGQFLGEMDVDPGSDVVNLNNPDRRSSFIGKFDSDGNYIMAEQISDLSVNAITIGASDSFYIVGASLNRGIGNSVIRKWTGASSPQSDLLLRNPSSGEIRILGLDKTQVKTQSAIQTSDGATINPGSEWKLVSGKSDLNGDRIQDLIWFNTTTGESAIWYMKQGTTGLNNIIDSASSYIYLPNAQDTLRVGAGWQLTSVDNLLGDDRPEFLWENRITGASAIWQLNIATNGRAELNLNTSDFIKLGGNIIETGGRSSGWKIAGVGNFDGNTATKDLLWFNETTSEMAVWQLNGTTIAGSGYLTHQGNRLRPAGWKPVAIGNIDGTSTDEIVLQNGTSVATWTLGSNFAVTDKSVVLAQTLVAGEQVQSLADLNADGTLDLVVRQKSVGPDSTQIYYLDATTFQLSTPTTTRFITQSQIPYTTGDRQWDIIDAADFGGPVIINNL